MSTFGKRSFGKGIASSFVFSSFLVSIPLFAAPLPSIIDEIPNSDLVVRSFAPASFGINLNEISNTNLVAPLQGVAVPGIGNELLMMVVDEIGKLWIVNINDGSKYALLDMMSSTFKIPLPEASEQGLLSAAFHPDFPTNGLFYTYSCETPDTKKVSDFPLQVVYQGSSTVNKITPGSQCVVREWQVITNLKALGSINSRVNSTFRELMRIDNPQANHLGGTLAFGPDKMLYLGTGDGGGLYDSAINHTGYNSSPTAQTNCSWNVLGLRSCFQMGDSLDDMRLTGKMIRIDVNARTSHNKQYGIPTDNPYYVQGTKGGLDGCKSGHCAEIYASGLRNPWRMSWDKATNRLIVGDVGQDQIEEIDIMKKGANYGWHLKEGSFVVQVSSGQPYKLCGGEPYCSDPGNCEAPDASPFGKAFVCDGRYTDPVLQYQHQGNGVAILGGYVYRGKKIPEMLGLYVFADFFDKYITFSSSLLYADKDFDQSPNQTTIKKISLPTLTCTNTTQCKKVSSPAFFIMGFGIDNAGELYLLGNWTASSTLRSPAVTGAFVTTGFIKRIERRP